MKNKASTYGFSLLELLVVIIILGIAAKVAIPFFSSGDDEKLEVAVSEIVQALRFAQSEALRRGTCIEVNIEPDGTLSQVGGLPPPLASNRNKVQVIMWADCASYSSPTPMTHPIDKKNYLLFIGNAPNTSGISTKTVTVEPFSNQYPYRIYFYSDGSPKSTTPTAFLFSIPIGWGYIPLTKGQISLGVADKTRTINICPSGKINIDKACT